MCGFNLGEFGFDLRETLMILSPFAGILILDLLQLCFQLFQLIGAILFLRLLLELVQILLGIYQVAFGFNFAFIQFLKLFLRIN